MELPGSSVFVGTHVKQPGRLAGQGESLMTCAQMALWLFLHCQWFIEVRPSVRWDHNFSPFCCLLIDDGRQTTAIRFSANERVRFIDRSSSYRGRTEGKKEKLRNGYKNESTIFQDNKMGHFHSPFSWSRHRLTYIKVNELRAMECNTRIKSEEVVTCRVLNKQGKKIQTMGWENYWSLMFGLARISFPVFLPIHSQNRWVLIS